MNLAIEDLHTLESEFEEDFIIFFKDLHNFVSIKN